MLKKDNRERVLGVFFDNPVPMGSGFQLREISRKISLAPLSVKKYLQELIKEKLIVKEKHRIHKYPVYYANRDSEYFRTLKVSSIMQSIKETGLLDYLYEKCMPDAIILFGSASKGEDVEESDIDIFMQCKETSLKLDGFERALSRKIQIHFAYDFNKLSKELRNNIMNGIVLKGYMKVF